MVPVHVQRPPLVQAVTAVTPAPVQQTAIMPHVEMNCRQPVNPDVRVIEVPPAIPQQFLRESVVEVPMEPMASPVPQPRAGSPAPQQRRVEEHVPPVEVQVPQLQTVVKHVPRPVVELRERTVFVPHVTRQEQLVPTPGQQVTAEVIKEVALPQVQEVPRAFQKP